MLARYVWSDDSGTLFQDALTSQQIPKKFRLPRKTDANNRKKT